MSMHVVDTHDAVTCEPSRLLAHLLDRPQPLQRLDGCVCVWLRPCVRVYDERGMHGASWRFGDLDASAVWGLALIEFFALRTTEY